MIIFANYSRCKRDNHPALFFARNFNLTETFHFCYREARKFIPYKQRKEKIRSIIIVQKF